MLKLVNLAICIPLHLSLYQPKRMTVKHNAILCRPPALVWGKQPDEKLIP